MTAFYSHLALSCTALTLLALTSSASAQILNGSFELNSAGSTTITGWNPIGSAIITDSSFGDAPASGTKQLFLNNDSQASDYYTTPNAVSVAGANGLESFLNLKSGALSSLGNGTATTGSGIQQKFTLTQTEQLVFSYDFVTAEDQTNSPNPDFGFASLTGSATSLSVLANAAQATVFEPAQTGRSSPSIDDYLSETGYKTYTFQALIGPGTYTLGLGVVNANTSDIGSGLLVDNITLTPMAAVPEASTAISMALLLGLGGLFCAARRPSRALAAKG